MIGSVARLGASSRPRWNFRNRRYSGHEAMSSSTALYDPQQPSGVLRLEALGYPHHCGLRLAACITLAHFSGSLLLCVANSSGVVPTTAEPIGAKRSCLAG